MSDLQATLPLPNQLGGWLPDETVFSWCSRYHRYSVNSRAYVTSRQLFGNQRGGYAHDLPSRIDEFVERTQGVLGTSEGVIGDRTLLPFYLPFRPLDKGKEAELRMRGPGVRSLKYQLGLLTSGLGADHPLKACPVCMEVDKHRHGVAYWHLAHQFPTSLVCPLHRKLLIRSAQKCQQLARFQWVLPSDAFRISTQETGLADGDQPDYLRLLRITEMGILASQSPRGAFADARKMAKAFRWGLTERDYITQGGRMRWSVIADSVKQYFRPYLIGPEFDCIRSIINENSLRRLLDGRSLTHPVRYITFIEWLFEDWTSFVSAYRSDMGMSQELPRPLPGVRPNHPLKERAQSLLETNRMTITAVARELQLDFTTVAAWAAENGIAPKRRPKTVDEKRFVTIVCELEAGRDKPVLAKKVGVSISTINKVLRTTPGLADKWHRTRQAKRRRQARSNWSTALEQWSGASLCLVRKLHKADYAWLYRNDRNWLRKTITDRSCKAGRDNHACARQYRYDGVLASAIEQAASAIAEKQGLKKISWESLIEVLPTLRRRQASLANCPQSLKILERVLI